MTPRDRFLQVLQGSKPDRLPVWFVGHCGVWDAHLRRTGILNRSDLDAKSDALPLLAAESANRWQLDAATSPTHLLGAAQLLGHTVTYSEQGQHRLASHLHSPQQLRALRVMPSTSIADTTTCVSMVAELAHDRAIIVPHVGPFTLSAHLIEGEAEWHPRYRALLFQYPTEARTLLTQAAGAIVAYGQHIQLAGAHALYIDETLSHLIGPEDQSIFILPYLDQIVKRLAPFPVIVRAPGMDPLAEHLRKTGVCGWQPDLHTDASVLRQRTLHSLAILGPFDPGRLLSPMPVVKQSVGRYIEAFGERDFIVSFASDPLPHTDPRNMQAFIETAQQFPIPH